MSAGAAPGLLLILGGSEMEGQVIACRLPLPSSLA